MRAGSSTIQQTLTPEAASVLNNAISEAGRRNHGQTTPLHVAATLLASPSGFLRQACIRSHPNSSHPLQCRALELCFSVALDRLPSSQNASPMTEPPISNALMAALKRAQAHQRRGCPEQQQQPLLAVKVELEQLIISILDDPSVSRVMREASFSSPAVKSTIEQTLNSSVTASSLQGPNPSSLIGLGFRPITIPSAVANTGRNLYLNARLQSFAQLGVGGRTDEVKQVVDILMRSRKHNPVLVGDSEPEAVMKELLRRIERMELGEGVLNNVHVIPLESHLGHDRSQVPSKIKELGDLIETRMEKLSGKGGIVLDLGDLKWLVEQPVGFGGAVPQPVVPEVGRAAVQEMANLLGRFAEGCAARLWLIGTATCETYLRCQVYHPSMENDWDLQAVPIAARVPLPGFTRLGTNGVLGNSIENLNSLKGFPTATNALPRPASENINLAQRTSCCPKCMENYEQQLAKLVVEEFEKSSSGIKPEEAKPVLPLWLQNAKAHNVDVKTSDQSQAKDQEVLWKQKTRELLKKWTDTCLHLHPQFHQNLCSTPLSMPSLYNPNLFERQNVQPKLQLHKNVAENLQLNSNSETTQPPEQVATLSRSPVRTDLALGLMKTAEGTPPEDAHKERVKELLGCIPSEPPQNRFLELQSQKLFSTTLDADSFKKLLKGVMQVVWWQREAASAVAAAVTQCKSGDGKCRGSGGGSSKGGLWLMFTGLDRVGKRKMATVLAELVCGTTTSPVMLCLGSRRCSGGEESDAGFRGKTTLERIVEVVRRNPFSLIMMEDVDEADAVVCGSIKRAMETGRLTDSYGREVSLGNVIFILTAEWLPENLDDSTNRDSVDEEKLARVSGGNWQLRLSVCEKTAKRQAFWQSDEIRHTKPRKEMASTLSFDLNLAADAAEENVAVTGDSRNSSNLTVDHEDERALEKRRSHTASAPSQQLLKSVDDVIIFRPVDFSPIRHEIAASIALKFSTVIGKFLVMEVEDGALEKILGGIWLGQIGFEEWAEKVLVPSSHQLKEQLPSSASAAETNVVVRLESFDNYGSRSNGDWLPSKISVVMDG